MSQTPPEKQAKSVWEVGTSKLQAAHPLLHPNNDTPRQGRFFKLRQPLSPVIAVVLGLLCIALVAGVWWFVTSGRIPEERLISPTALPSPSETFATFPSLWFERALTRNIFVTLRRLVMGFGLAAIIGIPLGVIAGCFPPIQAFLTPLILFGRNIPIAALIPLTFIFFGIAETQKIMFIFLACIAFIVSNAAFHVMAVGQEYIDTAYTLGAKRRHIVMKVLVPLAMPAIFDSLRLLFGLAFGYIMLAETVKFGNEEGGLGNLILMSQRRNLPAHIYLIILIIPIVALAIDRGLYFVQRQLFPHRYGGMGILKHAIRFCAYAWQDFKGIFLKPTPAVERMVADQMAAIAVKHPGGLASHENESSKKSTTEWRP